METVEIIVYMAVAVIIGGLVLLFIAGLPAERLYDTVENVIIGEEDSSFVSVTAEEFPLQAYRLWESCAFGTTNKNASVHLKGGTVTLEETVAMYKKLNLCYSIQSANQGCGSKEQIIMQEITGPNIVTITCDATNNTLIIS